MGNMKFIVDISANVLFRGIGIPDLGYELPAAEHLLDGLYSEHASVTGASFKRADFDISADMLLEEYEVSVDDFGSFTGREAIEDIVEHHDVTITNVSFNVVGEPAGFYVVSDAIDHEAACEVYAALERAGYEVS